MAAFFDRVRELWCIYVHAEVMWPYSGRYRCRTCLREFEVRFDDTSVETRHLHVSPQLVRAPRAV